MYTELLNVGLAFLEGFALIISPCILPILPFILTGSLTGSKARPFGIITGFIVTFTLVTLFSRVIITHLHISQEALRNFSFIVLLLLGIMMLSGYLTDKFNLLTQRLSNVGNSLQSMTDTQSGYWSGVLFGCLVGILWTPCAGPILAAVIVQVVIQETTTLSILTVIAFALGAGIPMLLIALVGRKIIDRFSFFRDHTVLLRKVLGLIIIATVGYLYYFGVSAFSVTPTVETKTQTLSDTLVNGIARPYPAPEFRGIDAWLNSSPLSLQQLRGKVVLIDFWTYSCINCVRTLPYLKDWYAKYRDKGFVIVGVHSPEFQFEHDIQNVKNALIRYGITYPVAIDNQFDTWRNYQNKFWPAHFLINKSGDVVYTHFGEGEYDVTEHNIQYLLGVGGMGLTPTSEDKYSSTQTPETYLGFSRSENYASREPLTKNAQATYNYPATLGPNKWALQGQWIVSADKIESAHSSALIKLHFNAGQVYAVMGVTQQPVIVTLRLNGKPIVAGQGKEVNNSEIRVSGHKLYHLISFQHESNGELELIVSGPGLELYTFTFGG